MKTKVWVVLSILLALTVTVAAVCAECNLKDPYLLMYARTSNWDCICPGTWSGTSWEIYSDGSYEIRIGYVSDSDVTYGPVIRTGKMSLPEFAAFLLACDCEWIDPAICVDACDGQGWALEMYDIDGNVIHTTGGMGYIYGQENAERIAHMLPEYSTSCDYNSAYISFD